ncbi:hypothetical protein BXZ70DRAFT_575425 [Cristinia sonorae]|uniref:Uncharacterized protein n=1 Tax=Cristinia sonorae TaxID=1940300 RepID=A0A8K0UF33_9AGAR|nr:hypothetical protein BXZ70DRAFT_575425 [Cristinia sonorae]
MNRRIRKISDLFKKPEAPVPDNFLDVSISRRDKDHDAAKKRLNQLKHVKSLPLRTNKPTYRGGQRVPKDQIVYPLIPKIDHVDIDPRPSTSSYDTYNSEPALLLLPPPSEELKQYTESLQRARKAERERERNKPLPPSPRGPRQPYYATTHSAAVRSNPTKSPAPAKVPGRATAAKEVAKPVPGVALPSKNAHLQQVATVPQPTANQQHIASPPTAKFTNMFKPMTKQADRTAQAQTAHPAPAKTPSGGAAEPAKKSRPFVFDNTSDDSLSVYSDQFSMDSVSVLTNEEPPKIPYVRYHNARTGDEGVHPVRANEFGVVANDSDRSGTSSRSSLTRQPAIRRTGSSGSLVYQSDTMKATGGKTTHAQEMLNRAHKAAAVASLRATPAAPSPGSAHTKVQAPHPSAGAYMRTVEKFRAAPLEAGIPFPVAALSPKREQGSLSKSPTSHPPAVSPSSSRDSSSRGHSSQNSRQYYDPLYFSAKNTGAVLALPARSQDHHAQSPVVSSSTSFMQSAPPRTRPVSPKLRDVVYPVAQATIRPLNPQKRNRDQAPPIASSSRTPEVHPPALHQSLAKQSVHVTKASGAGSRKSCKAVIVATDGGLSDEELLDLALHEPEFVTPVPMLPAEYKSRKAQPPPSSRAHGNKHGRKY